MTYVKIMHSGRRGVLVSAFHGSGFGQAWAGKKPFLDLRAGLTVREAVREAVASAHDARGRAVGA